MRPDDLRWPPTSVPAPRRAVGWAAETGFLYDADELDELIAEGCTVLDVTDPEPTAAVDEPAGEPFVVDVEGAAPLHAVVRVDRDIAHLHARIDHLVQVADAAERYVEDLHTRLISITEDAQQRLVARNG